MTYESRRLLSLFRFCFYWMCEFQVSRVFDVNSSLEKRLDIMVVFYDFVFPHDLQHQQRPKLFLVSDLYHIFGAYFSVALVCSRFCWLQSGMQQKFPISCLMCNCLNLPFLFSLFHTACLELVLLFLVLAQSCPLIHCDRNRPTGHVDTVISVSYTHLTLPTTPYV